MMKMERILVIGLVILSLLLIPVTAFAGAGITVVSKAGNGTWEGNSWNVLMYPAETKSATITLYNSSTRPLEVCISIIPLFFDGGNLAFELDKSTYIMEGGTYSTVTLTAKASSNTTPGRYATELAIKLGTEDDSIVPFIPYWAITIPTSSPMPSPVPTLIPSPTTTLPHPTDSPSSTPTTIPTPTPIVTPFPTIPLSPTSTPISVSGYSWSKIPLWLIVVAGLPLLLIFILGSSLLVINRKYAKKK